MKLIDLSIIILVGLLLAGWSAKYVIENRLGTNVVEVGPWSAMPFVGGKQVDPYTKSSLSVSGKLPLGAAEGLTFTATEDDEGNPLLKNCNYTLSGETPLGRFWTLAAYDDLGAEITSEKGQISGIFSGSILRYPNSSFEIAISDYPQSGNWFAISGNGPFKLILRLYDTPVVSNIGVTVPKMPAIRKAECT